MCVIIAGKTQPDTTKLMNIPVIIDDNKYNFFMYINNFDLYKNSEKFGNFDVNKSENFGYIDIDKYMKSVSLINNNSNNSFGNYATFDSNQNSNENVYNNSVMVVPFPVNLHTSSSQIGLVDITTNDMKLLRNKIKSLKPQPRSIYVQNSFSDSYSISPLEVHKIGNYNISIATSYRQLLENVDWTKFTKPSNFEQRINTFKNSQLYPQNYAYFYVIASAIENIQDDGFGIVYPQLEGNITYIPTAHEDTELEHKFDVEIYNFGYDKENINHNKNYLHQILNELKNIQVKMINNVYKKMNYDTNISSFNFIEENKLMKNHNIFMQFH